MGHFANLNSELRTNIIRYCLDVGIGITYDKNSKTFTTEEEVATHSPIRYVQESTLDYLASPEIIEKTKFIINARKICAEPCTDIRTFDEWVALCRIFKRNDISLEDAVGIIKILNKYDVSPLYVEVK